MTAMWLEVANSLLAFTIQFLPLHTQFPLAVSCWPVTAFYSGLCSFFLALANSEIATLVNNQNRFAARYQAKVLIGMCGYMEGLCQTYWGPGQSGRPVSVSVGLRRDRAGDS